jgi:hypothetical protein
MGHGGADFFTMNNFVRAIANDDKTLLGTGVLVIANLVSQRFFLIGGDGPKCQKSGFDFL